MFSAPRESGKDRRSMDQNPSAYAHLYLGKNAEGPAPVFRDLSPEGLRLPGGTLVPWPDNAVFGVFFSRACFPRAAELTPEAPLDAWEFFDETGWPVDLPHPTRIGLADATKRELQVYPRAWRTWNEKRWQDARDFPDVLRMLRRQTGIFLRGVALHAPGPTVR
jgi:hypothetical protein